MWISNEHFNWRDKSEDNITHWYYDINGKDLIPPANPVCENDTTRQHKVINNMENPCKSTSEFKFWSYTFYTSLGRLALVCIFCTFCFNGGWESWILYLIYLVYGLYKNSRIEEYNRYVEWRMDHYDK